MSDEIYDWSTDRDLAPDERDRLPEDEFSLLVTLITVGLFVLLMLLISALGGL